MSSWFHEEFRDAFPLAFIMREKFPENWLRIHSLPESKRYPEDDEERAVVLQRYGSFGTSLLGSDVPCCMIRARFNTEELDYDLRGAWTWTPLHRIDESDEDYWSAWSADVVWQPDAFRGLLMQIADDRDSGVMFVSKRSDCIFAPYDGGADGFSFDTGLIARLKVEFGPWLSSRQDGL